MDENEIPKSTDSPDPESKTQPLPISILQLPRNYDNKDKYFQPCLHKGPSRPQIVFQESQIKTLFNAVLEIKDNHFRGIPRIEQDQIETGGTHIA